MLESIVTIVVEDQNNLALCTDTVAATVRVYFQLIILKIFLFLALVHMTLL
jgi:hypothetical protein